MKDTFIQLSEYIESLEQRIAALEAAMAAMTLRTETIETRAAGLEARALEAESKLHTLQQEPQPVVAVETRKTVELKKTEVPVSEPEPVVEEPVSEPEPIEEEPAVQPEPVVESAPAAPVMPQQTSLFGTAVSDIRQAISIGDRFLFQRELFGGNGELMQKTLDRLNVCADMNEALQLVGQMSWDTQSSTYELFLNVLRRRF